MGDEQYEGGDEEEDEEDVPSQYDTDVVDETGDENKKAKRRSRKRKVKQRQQWPFYMCGKYISDFLDKDQPLDRPISNA